MTVMIQNSRTNRLVVERYVRPWIVEDSRNALTPSMARTDVLATNKHYKQPRYQSCPIQYLLFYSILFESISKHGPPSTNIYNPFTWWTSLFLFTGEGRVFRSVVKKANIVGECTCTLYNKYLHCRRHVYSRFWYFSSCLTFLKKWPHLFECLNTAFPAT